MSAKHRKRARHTSRRRYVREVRALHALADLRRSAPRIAVRCRTIILTEQLREQIDALREQIARIAHRGARLS